MVPRAHASILTWRNTHIRVVVVRNKSSCRACRVHGASRVPNFIHPVCFVKCYLSVSRFLRDVSTITVFWSAPSTLLSHAVLHTATRLPRTIARTPSRSRRAARNKNEAYARKHLACTAANPTHEDGAAERRSQPTWTSDPRLGCDRMRRRPTISHDHI